MIGTIPDLPYIEILRHSTVEHASPGTGADMASLQLTSSPLSSVEPSQQSDQPSKQTNASYQKAQLLPFELAQHVQTYFEESLFLQAFNSLYSVASSTVSNNVLMPLKIPPPEYLAVTATLAVHPTLTTRAKSKDKVEQANAALKLLRLILRTTGPINAQFNQAFAFDKFSSRSSRGTNHQHGKDEDSNHMQKLSISYADSESLFTLAEDFWAAVGWSLNCSCLHGMYALRWERWSLWLEFMLEVLEKDWKLHLQGGMTPQSLLWQYVNAPATSNPRRILRSIFADGSTSSLNEFNAVFHKELRRPKSDQQKIKRREVKVNVEEEVYGDYMAAEDSSDSSNADNNDLEPKRAGPGRPSKRIRTRTPSKRRHASHANEPDHEEGEESDGNNRLRSPSSLGSPQSLSIRLRLMSLLVGICTDSKLMTDAKTRNVMPDLQDLFTLFVDFIKPLSLPTFQQFISPSAFPEETFSGHTQVTLCTFLLQRLLESSAPVNKNLENGIVTQKTLVEAYLPFAAAKATIDAQCRTSLVLETLVRRLAIAGHLRKTADLIAAIDGGIERRKARVANTSETKARRKTGKPSTEEEEEAWIMLVESGKRMKMVADGLKPASIVNIEDDE